MVILVAVTSTVIAMGWALVAVAVAAITLVVVSVVAVLALAVVVEGGVAVVVTAVKSWTPMISYRRSVTTTPTATTPTITALIPPLRPLKNPEPLRLFAK